MHPGTSSQRSMLGKRSCHQDWCVMLSGVGGDTYGVAGNGGPHCITEAGGSS